MKTRRSFLVCLMLASAQALLAWSGAGTKYRPYLITSTADWQELAARVAAGESFSGQTFRLTDDVDAQGTSVGTADNPFSGTFDGWYYTLTYNKGAAANYAAERCAPFLYVSGATIRHLYTTGTIYSSEQYAGGIVSMVNGSSETKLADCHSDIRLFTPSQAIGGELHNAAHGGLVGAVNTGGLLIDRCTFTGEFSGENSAGMVGWSNVDITIRNSVVDFSNPIFVNGGRTFARMAGGTTATLTDCYFTLAVERFDGLSAEMQGECVFDGINVPEGCSYEFESEPTVKLGRKKYWKSGARVRLTAPDNVAFDHWTTGFNGCYINDPWARDAIHVLADVKEKPSFSIATQMPTAKTMHTFYGVKYRYLSTDDYHLYLSDVTCKEKNWSFDSDGYLVTYDKDGDKLFITAAVGYEGNINHNFDGAWIWETSFSGTILQNDNMTGINDRTHLGVIAPRAFKGCKDLKSLAFQSDEGHPFFKTIHQPDFIIGEEAFADCPNLTRFVMMYYNRTGTDKWDVMPPTWVIDIAPDAFNGSDNCRIMVDPTVYQQYLSDERFAAHWNRISLYMKAEDDMKVNGAVYSYMRNSKGEAVKNDAAGHESLMSTLRYWNADYQNFSASSLLTNSDKNIWYAQVTGVDESSLDSDGTMRIYNDPGSYYNYKTIAIGENAFRGNEKVKAIEFWQTNGRSENSFTDLKIVIQNGAFKNCENLKELRLFYYVQDGDDHWEVLGPENVIPGNNIFGKEWPDDPASLSDEELHRAVGVPAGFKILVSPSRIEDFMADPNWQPYLCYMEAVDFNPTAENKDFTMSGQPGVTYAFITTPGGITESSATVSQDVSWWTAPRIAVEVALYALSIKSVVQAIDAASTVNLIQPLQAEVTEATNEFLRVTESWNYLNYINDFLQNALMKFRPFQTVFNGPYASTNIEILLKELPEEVVNNAIKDNLIFKVGATRYLNTAASEELFTKFGRQVASKMDGILSSQWLGYTTRRTIQQKAINALAAVLPSTRPLALHTFLASLNGGLAASITTAGYLSAKSWGGSGTYNGELLQKGMRENIISNMHQVGISGGGYIITTPVKNLVHHTYIKEVADDVTHAVIYAGTDRGQGHNTNTRTMALGRYAFRDHKQLTYVSFHESNVTTNEAIPMLLTIPDSAFVGCDHLQELRLLVETDGHGTRALGPESFILGGDSIFAGLSPETFHIVIDPSRRQDFLDNASWQPLEKYFVYEAAKPKDEYNEYGGKYAYAYENGSVQKVHKVMGHKIEHTIVTGPTTESGKYLLSEHQGALKLCNDIGSYNNYQLDAVSAGAFKGCDDLRVVYFTDLYGQGAFGDSYTGLDVTLEDSCFAHCKNLADVDLLYLVTDGDNHIDPITPRQLKIGKGVLDGTDARIKMMPQQVEWFMADSAWVAYKDRFMPCVIQPGDPAVLSLLEDMTYYDMAATGYDTQLWTGYIDLARIAGVGFQWLDGRFKGNTEVRSFPDFEYFGSVGLDYVGDEWFHGCSGLSDIRLPRTLRRLGGASFEGCALTTIELPDNVEFIGGRAFFGCPLRTVIVRGRQPARMDSNPFPYHDDLHIYVPSGTVDVYREAWPDYAPYIYDESWQPGVKEVVLTKAGTLADKLGLSVEWSYSGAIAGDEPRFLHGCYTQYDSLTVSGPLNDLDLAVLRYMAGSDSYTRGGRHTDGRLRHLNLYDARIVKDNDCKAHYVNLSWGLSPEWHAVDRDNELPHYLFHNCTALESVVLPKSLTSIGPRIFEGCSSLKRVAVAGSIGNYVESHWLKGLLDYPLEELTLATDSPARSENSDPWGQPVDQVYTQKSQLADYMGQPYLVKQAMSITAPFADEAVMTVLARRGRFFPSDYARGKSAEGLFNDNSEITSLDEFACFTGVTALERTFHNARNLQRVALPASITRIGSDAFEGCDRLDTIRVACDSVPELAADAFRDLPSTFSILVPKQLCKLYRATWPQYADHINPDNTLNSGNDMITVELTEPNTLAAKLGLTVTTDSKSSVWAHDYQYVTGIRGDYSNVHRLKIIGPISGQDLSVLRFLSGFCPWTNSHSSFAPLEYIDLYDAQLKASDFAVASDMFWKTTRVVKVDDDDVLPAYSFLQAYNLKTLILPRTCKEVRSRALQQCEALESLVVGDKTTDFNWSALDDDAMLSRLYLLCEKKPELDMDNWMWRNLCNNYHPTFDAFYVRPSLYKEYLADPAYTTDTWQRTNNISMGEFANDEESFCAFASHAAATADDLSNVTSVDRWFDAHPGVKDLTPLQYTSVDSLSKATIAPLTQLEKVALPVSLTGMEDSLFVNAKRLRYVDFLNCDSTDVVSSLRDGGFKRLGINTEQTLVYVPQSYGESDGANIVTGAKDGKLYAKAYHMVDSLSYMVPYAFNTDSVKNTRTLVKSEIPYTVCVPYKMQVPKYARAYELSERSGSTLIFEEVTGELEAMKPYLLKVVGNRRFRRNTTTLNTDIAQEIPANGNETYGHQDDVMGYSLRGTFEAVDNKTAAELGAYILQSDGDWHPVSTSNDKACVLPFRAYLLPSAHHVKEAISMTLEDTTGIDTIETIDNDGTHRYYDLGGRELPGKPAKGVYIYNGKKYINK